MARAHGCACRGSSTRTAWAPSVSRRTAPHSTDRPPIAAEEAPPTADQLATANAAVRIILLRSTVGGKSVDLEEDAVFRALAGWSQPVNLPRDAAALIEAIVHLVRCAPRAAVFEAVRRWLVPPKCTLAQLRAPGHAWFVTKEIYLSRCFYDVPPLLRPAPSRRTARPPTPSFTRWLCTVSVAAWYSGPASRRSL